MNSPDQFYSPIPKHVAIIMDGNRRWAKLRDKDPIEGYRQGAETLTKIVRVAGSLGIKCLTVYSFSTENWKRPQTEIDALMDLFAVYLRKESASMVSKGVCLKSIGDLTLLPKKVQNAFHEVKEATKREQNLQLVIAMNYGARDELVRSMQKMFCDLEAGLIEKNDLTEETFTKYLDTAGMQDPDLLIRTSGEFRLSNFLLWQLSYAEIEVIDQLWPDVSEKDFLGAIRNFQKRKRRCGS
ncbi:MAG: polyprenyl diphosphate synthase [Chlamydiota bacterium]